MLDSLLEHHATLFGRGARNPEHQRQPSSSGHAAICIAMVVMCALSKLHAQVSPPGPPSASSRGERPGPWDQDVLVYRVQTNGVATQTGKFERAGVATLARLNDGRLCAAHQHFPEDSEADFDKVAVRFSSDEGRSWTAPTVIRLSGLPEGMRFPFDPTLVTLPDGRVRLYFTSLRGRRFEEATPAIYSAISSNAVDYTVEPGMRFGIDERRVIDGAVVLHKGTFHLFAPDNGPQRAPGNDAERQRRRDDRASEGVGYHATSKDGLRFKRVDDVRIDGRRRWLGNAQSDGKVITFYGTGDGEVWIGTSDDGENWKLAPGINGVRAADPGAVSLRDRSLLVIGTGPPRPATPSAEPARRRPR